MIESEEYAYSLEDLTEFYGGMKMKIYVPKLMPDVDIKKMNKIETKRIYCNSMYINTKKESRPSCGSDISFQYYITGIVNYNSNYKHLLNENGVIPKGTRFKCTFMNGDINKCFIDTDIN
jgi:hypothetical protein